MTIPEAFAIAVQHHQSGLLGEAEAIYRQILAVDPRHADALHLLGAIAYQAGRNDLAVDWIGQAIQQNPHEPAYHSNLGAACLNAGRLDEAIAACRTAIRLKPEFADAHSNLGNALWARGHLDEAIAACRTAIRLKPEFANAHSNLGNALRTQGHLDEAIEAYRTAIRFQPDFAEAHSNLGVALAELGQFEEAAAASLRAIALQPDYAPAGYNLGNALRALGQIPEAIAAYQRTLQLKPEFVEAHVNLGNAFKDEGRLDEAIVAYRRAIDINPDSAEAHFNLGNAFKEEGRLDEAIAGYRRALQLQPDFVAPSSSLLMILHYLPGCDPQTIFAEHGRWSQSHAGPLAKGIQVHRNDRDPQRRLRVGYVSPDFREHAVVRFLLPLLENHDRRAFEIFAYAEVPVPDAMTRRLRSLTDQWRSLVGLSDEQAAELIRQDGIDILVDLAGHTPDNRLLVFARKPAPVQVTWLGYPNTTGLDTIDYRLTDAFADPIGLSELHCSEELVRLPACAWCFAPPASPPITGRQQGPITFGCFNKFAKLTDPMLALWGRILRAVPESRLLLKSASFGSASVRQRLQQIFGALDLAPERLELRRFAANYGGHLGLYERMDIALDTFPYHGTTTTCEALWMGVPVVSLAGGSHVSRVGVSLLGNVGLPELVATNPEEYVRIALALARDLPRLAQLRSTLRERMAASPLMDAPRFARDLEAAYRQMWKKWCGRAAR